MMSVWLSEGAEGGGAGVGSEEEEEEAEDEEGQSGLADCPEKPSPGDKAPPSSSNTGAAVPSAPLPLAGEPWGPTSGSLGLAAGLPWAALGAVTWLLSWPWQRGQVSWT